MMMAAMEIEEHVSTRRKNEVREALERWARWCDGAKYHGGGGSRPGRSRGLLGDLRDGRGSTVCPTCKGARRMPGHLVGSSYEFLNIPCPGCDGDGKVEGDLAAAKRSREIDCVFCLVIDPVSGRRSSTGELPGGGTCPKCQGGKRLLVELKVHPATIKGTRYLGPDGGPDPVVALVDKTVRGWSEHNETYWLARVVREEYCANGTQEMKATRMGVSRVWYAKNLIAAHQRMGEVLRA